MLPIAAIVAAVLVRCRCLRSDALKHGPDRAIGLRPEDLLVGFGLLIVGSLIAPLVDEALSSVDGATDGPLLRQSYPVLLRQCLGQFPVAFYLLWRAAQITGGLRRIGAVPKQPLREAFMALVALAAALPLTMAVSTIFAEIGTRLGEPAPELAHDLLKLIWESESHLSTILLVGSAVAGAAVLEEVIFRGLVQSVLVEAFGGQRRWTAVMLAAFVFASIHAGPASFDPQATGGVPWQVLPTLFTLAVILGWLYERSGSLWPSILLHGGFNAFNVVMVLLVFSPPDT